MLSILEARVNIASQLQSLTVMEYLQEIHRIMPGFFKKENPGRDGKLNRTFHPGHGGGPIVQGEIAGRLKSFQAQASLVKFIEEVKGLYDQIPLHYPISEEMIGAGLSWLHLIDEWLIHQEGWDNFVDNLKREDVSDEAIVEVQEAFRFYVLGQVYLALTTIQGEAVSIAQTIKEKQAVMSIINGRYKEKLNSASTLQAVQKIYLDKITKPSEALNFQETDVVTTQGVLVKYRIDNRQHYQMFVEIREGTPYQNKSQLINHPLLRSREAELMIRLFSICLNRGDYLESSRSLDLLHSEECHLVLMANHSYFTEHPSFFPEQIDHDNYHERFVIAFCKQLSIENIKSQEAFEQALAAINSLSSLEERLAVLKSLLQGSVDSRIRGVFIDLQRRLVFQQQLLRTIGENLFSDGSYSGINIEKIKVDEETQIALVTSIEQLANGPSLSTLPVTVEMINAWCDFFENVGAELAKLREWQALRLSAESRAEILREYRTLVFNQWKERFQNEAQFYGDLACVVWRVASSVMLYEGKTSETILCKLQTEWQSTVEQYFNQNPNAVSRAVDVLAEEAKQSNKVFDVIVCLQTFRQTHYPEMSRLLGPDYPLAVEGGLIKTVCMRLMLADDLKGIDFSDVIIKALIFLPLELGKRVLSELTINGEYYGSDQESLLVNGCWRLLNKEDHAGNSIAAAINRLSDGPAQARVINRLLDKIVAETACVSPKRRSHSNIFGNRRRSSGSQSSQQKSVSNSNFLMELKQNISECEQFDTYQIEDQIESGIGHILKINSSSLILPTFGEAINKFIDKRNAVVETLKKIKTIYACDPNRMLQGVKKAIDAYQSAAREWNQTTSNGQSAYNLDVDELKNLLQTSVLKLEQMLGISSNNVDENALAEAMQEKMAP